MDDHQSNAELHCEGYRREDGIYVLVVHRSTRQAVHEGKEHYLRWCEGHTAGTPMCLLIDLRPDGFPPLKYSFNVLRLLFQDHPLPQDTYVSYMLEGNSSLITVAHGLFDLLRLPSQRRFFYGEHAEAEALAFLYDHRATD